MATLQDKITRIASALAERTGLNNLIPGSKGYQIAQSAAYEQMQIERLVENKTADNSLLTAEGDALDIIGNKFFGTPRNPEVKTFVTKDMKALRFYVNIGTFGNINNYEDIVIPEGTLVEGTVDGSTIRLRVSAQTTLQASESEAYVDADLVQGPSIPIPAGVMIKHNFSNYAQSIAKTLLVTNPIVIGTGRQVESDDNYRYRLINSLRAFAKTNTAGIFVTATNIPGVSDAQIKNADSGGGTFTVYVQGVASVTPDDTIADVATAISESVPPWASFKVLKPNYIGIQMGITVTTRYPNQYIGNEGFITGVQNIISSYINNFFGSEIYILDALKAAEISSSDILDISLGSLKIYTGINKFRSAKVIDLTEEPNPSIAISNIEKVIIEPISNPIIVTVE